MMKLWKPTKKGKQNRVVALTGGPWGGKKLYLETHSTMMFTTRGWRGKYNFGIWEGNNG